MPQTTATDGEYYPVRDSCKCDGDPAEGCYLTKALYYAANALLLNQKSEVVVLGRNRSQVARVAFKKDVAYVLDKNELECLQHMYTALFSCDG